MLMRVWRPSLRLCARCCSVGRAGDWPASLGELGEEGGAVVTSLRTMGWLFCSSFPHTGSPKPTVMSGRSGWRCRGLGRQRALHSLVTDLRLPVPARRGGQRPVAPGTRTARHPGWTAVQPRQSCRPWPGRPGRGVRLPTADTSGQHTSELRLSAPRSATQQQAAAGGAAELS